MFLKYIPLGDEALPHHLQTGVPPQSPVGHARDFNSFKSFFQSKIALYVAPSSAQAFFRRIFLDYDPVHSGFRTLLQMLESGDDLHATTDGSVIEDGEASSGWHFWRTTFDDDEDDDDDVDDEDQEDKNKINNSDTDEDEACLLYTSPSPRDS